VSMRWWPRSIRWQMMAGLVLLEALSIGLFAVLLLQQQAHDVNQRAQKRLEYEATSLALQVREALLQQQSGWIGLSVKLMGQGPSVTSAKVTDPLGNVVFASSGDPSQIMLTPPERAEIQQLKNRQPGLINRNGNLSEAVAPIYIGDDLHGYAWVVYDRIVANELLTSITRDTLLFGIIWIVASALLVLGISYTISKPLAILHRGASALMASSENSGDFPLPVTIHNEIGDLIETFNRMVASLAEQRAGLNDTLSLLDSMLANAPIGLAFFDRNCRFVRVNQVFADLTGVPLSRHLGRTLPELLPQPVANDLEDAVLRVFESEMPVRNLEISGQSGKPVRPWTWLISAYPVRTTSHQVRWAGAIVLDASDRKRTEEALRKSEKLAVTGRLAAAIAHEINNPLEAITNLLFLLRNFSRLDGPALNYVTMAEYEVRRISEITQQTLRFFRQSTLPARTTMAELLDSVLSLYQGRLNALNIQIEREYDPKITLFCFAGEIRQVFANLVGNAIDATGENGRLRVRARRSCNWKNPTQKGIRFTFADTGVGMEPEVRERIFEAFFTTKEVTGTGLGLWVSYEIVLKHHGTIHVRSRTAAQTPDNRGKSSGTVFHLFLPDDSALTGAVQSGASDLQNIEEADATATAEPAPGLEQKDGA
jgi:PAS domain S-box-containing protein